MALNSPYKYQNDSVSKLQTERLIECFKFIHACREMCCHFCILRNGSVAHFYILHNGSVAHFCILRNGLGIDSESIILSLCVLLVIGELGTTVSECIQLVCFHNSDSYACMNPKSLEENFKKSSVPSTPLPPPQDEG